MTETLPRPIEPGEIRVGDRVRRTEITDGITCTYEITVARIDGRALISGVGGTVFASTADATWTLLDRPTPAPAVGSRWRAPDGAKYVKTDGPQYVRYRSIPGGADGVLDPNYARQAAVIARLTPIPDHGDGCSPWLWDEETGTAYVLAKDGSYHVVQGDGYPLCAPFARYSCVRDCASVEARLVPWSERGQANG